MVPKVLGKSFEHRLQLVRETELLVLLAGYTHHARIANDGATVLLLAGHRFLAELFGVLDLEPPELLGQSVEIHVRHVTADHLTYGYVQLLETSRLAQHHAFQHLQLRRQTTRRHPAMTERDHDNVA